MKWGGGQITSLERSIAKSISLQYSAMSLFCGNLSDEMQFFVQSRCLKGVDINAKQTGAVSCHY